VRTKRNNTSVNENGEQEMENIQVNEAKEETQDVMEKERVCVHIKL